MAAIRLFPVPPYDFSLSAAIFSNGDPGIRIFREGVYRHARDIHGRPVLVEVRDRGTVDVPAREVTIRPDPGIVTREWSEAAELVASMFNISDTLLPGAGGSCRYRRCGIP